MNSQRQMLAAVNRLARWRAVFANWQLGTRAIGDPESDAVRDHRELSILLRAELTALTGLLIEKGICTAEDFQNALTKEAEELNRDYELRFPGFTALDSGMQLDERAAKTTAGWKP